MDIPVKTESKKGKLIKLLLKIAVTAICLWYVSGKIDFAKVGSVIKNANWFYLILAIVAFIFSKWISAIRINIYFQNISIALSHWQNVKLYWLGMFYNLFLPGSITGDAYKVILLTRQSGVPYKKTTAAVLLDRFSGLLALGLILGTYSILVLKNKGYIFLLIASAVAAILVLYFIIKKIFPPDIESWLMQSLQNPAASSCAEDGLLRVLKKYDPHKPGIYFVEELPVHSFFKVKGGKIFTKGNKVRKRFLCKENSTGKLFLFSPVAEVELVR